MIITLAAATAVASFEVVSIQDCVRCKGVQHKPSRALRVGFPNNDDQEVRELLTPSIVVNSGCSV